MSWYHADWKYRIPFMLHNATAGTARDGTFTVPADMGKFWRHVQADLDDVRVTAADGMTLLTYDVTSVNYQNKTATIRIDGYDWSANAWGSANATYTANTAGSAIQGFIYFGNTTASSAAGNSVSLSNAVTLTIDNAAPGAAGSPVVTCEAQRIGQTLTDKTIVKQSTETTRVWWDLRKCMLYRLDRENRSALLEEIAWVQVQCHQIDGNTTHDRSSTMLNPATIATMNFHIVQHEVTAGASGGVYLLTLLVGTDDGRGGTRVIEQNCTLKVQDLEADTN